MNAMDRSGVSEAAFITESFRRGWEIAKPFHQNQAFDYVIRMNPKNQWKTVQVKTAYLERGSLCVSFRRSVGSTKGRKLVSYKKGDFDFLFVVSGNKFWMIPWNILEGKKSCICVSSKKYLKYIL